MDLEKSCADLRKTSLSWNTILNTANIYSEYEQLSLIVIKNFLDYLPDQAIYVPHQLFVKTCLVSYCNGEMSEKDTIRNLETHCKHVRNDDMKKYGWANPSKYDQFDYDFYETYLSIFKEKARRRLCELIVWEDAPLEYTLAAEIFLRQLFMEDSYHDRQPYGPVESRAVTIASYRQVLIDEGQEAADSSPLYGQFLCKEIGLSPLTFKKLP